MKVAILQCDHVLEPYRQQFGDYDAMIRRMFADLAADPDTGPIPPLEFDNYDCQLLEYPDRPEDYDFFITTGSRASVYDDLPWNPPLFDFIRRLDRERRKLIGICYGHQAIAVALGCRVERSPRGWGIGLSHNRVITHPPWMNPPLDELRILVSHQDQVIDLPEGAEIIATSDHCPNYLVQWNDHFLSIQGHPEWCRDYAGALIEVRRERYPKGLADRAIGSLGEEPDNRAFGRWVVAFVAGA